MASVFRFIELSTEFLGLLVRYDHPWGIKANKCSSVIFLSKKKKQNSSFTHTHTHIYMGLCIFDSLIKD